MHSTTDPPRADFVVVVETNLARGPVSQGSS